MSDLAADLRRALTKAANNSAAHGAVETGDVEEMPDLAFDRPEPAVPLALRHMTSIVAPRSAQAFPIARANVSPEILVSIGRQMLEKGGDASSANLQAFRALLVWKTAQDVFARLPDAETRSLVERAIALATMKAGLSIAGPQHDASAWPAPRPLPTGLPPVSTFDFALLPNTLRPWAEDICERVQCPPDFVAVTIMAALGAVIGRKVLVRPQERTDWTETPNQWALVIGRPGVLKSPAMEAALAPLKRLASKATDSHSLDLDNFRHASKVAKLRAEAGEKAARGKLAKNADADVSGDLAHEEPQEPTLRRYIATDTTAAALGELMRQNPNGILVHRDEMVSLLKGLDREDNAEARGFYLSAWNGNSAYTFDRIGRGLNLHVPAVCLSMLGSTQPGRAAEYLRAAVNGGAGDDGLIQRFGLLVWPDVSGEWREVDRWPDSDARRKAHEVFERLQGLDACSIGAQSCDLDGGAPFLRFDSDALALFRGWREPLEARLRSGELHPALESHLAKYRKLVSTLALILHLADDGRGPVSSLATLQALAWAEYLETHARRAYASVASPEVASATEIVKRIRSGEVAREFAARDVYRNGWTHLSDREQVIEALHLLVDLDWLASENRSTGGRAATVFLVNPKGFAA
jgi:putative DNA primase/helicase